MASFMDAARMMAAGGGAGMDAGPAEPQGGVEAMEPQGGQDPVGDLSGIVDSLEAAAAALPQQFQEKLRQHVEGIRQIVEEASAENTAKGTEQQDAAPGDAPPAASEPGLGGEGGM